jgi:hypothetical protein
MPVELNLHATLWWRGMILILGLTYWTKFFPWQQTPEQPQHQDEAGRP